MLRTNDSRFLVRAVALEHYPELVRELGGDPGQLLRQAGLEHLVADAEGWVPYHRMLALLEESATALNCPHFGLLLSKHQGLDALGTVGFVMQQASDVGTALTELRKYFRYYNQGAVVDLAVENRKALLSFSERSLGFAPWHQQSDLAAGIGVHMMRLLCGDGWNPDALYLPHAAPANARPYREIFRCPIIYDWDRAAMVFAEAVLATPLSPADPRLQHILEQHLYGLERSYPDDFGSQVRHLIRQAMDTGDCSLDRVAGYLSLHKRTLQRRLRDAGLNYQNLLDEVRFDQATRQMRESRCSLTELAERLCYSDLSAFSYAFKQRFEMSPRAWRKQHMTRG